MTEEVALFAKAVQQHWGIENSVYWVLDIGFREDESRIWIGHAPENRAVLGHIALNLLRSSDTLDHYLPFLVRARLPDSSLWKEG